MEKTYPPPAQPNPTSPEDSDTGYLKKLDEVQTKPEYKTYIKEKEILTQSLDPLLKRLTNFELEQKKRLLFEKLKQNISKTSTQLSKRLPSESQSQSPPHQPTSKLSKIVKRLKIEIQKNNPPCQNAAPIPSAPKK